MKLRVKTENSTYYIDTEAKTWKRVETNGIVDKHPLRTTEGSFNALWPVALGYPMTMECDPLPTSAPGTTVRLITTSCVQSYEEQE